MNKTGLGFCCVLGIVFVVLKLCGVISWSWLWVLSPFWIRILLGIIAVAVVVWLMR